MLRPIEFKLSRGHSLALVSAALFGTLAVSGKYAYADGVGVQALMAWRFAGSAVLFWLWLLVSRRNPFPNRAIVFRLFAVGFGVLALEVTLFFYGLAAPGISAGLGETIFFIYPAWAVLIGSGTGRHHYLAAGMAILGIALTAGTLAADSPWGIAALISASLLYAIYVVLSGKWLVDIDPWVGSTWMVTGAAIALLLAQSIAQSPGPSSISGWLAVFSAVGLGTFAAYALLYLALRTVLAATVAVLTTAEPVIAVILGAVMLGERMNLLQVLGSGMILGSVAYLLWVESKVATAEVH